MSAGRIVGAVHSAGGWDACDRKLEHLRLALEERMQLRGQFFDDYVFEHRALPEIDFREIDTSVTFLGRRLSAPLIISCMTGGNDETARINRRLARGAESETIAVGVKADFPDQNLRVNLAVYDTQVDNLQANSWTGTGFNVQNAGNADTSGWELETWWQPTDTLGFQAFWVRSDAKYDDFLLGTCWDAWVFHNGQPDPNSGGDIEANICPRTGGRLAYNPEDTFFFSFTKDFMIGNSMVAYVRGEYSYYSETLTDGDLDPFTNLDSLDLINARLGLRWEDAGAEVVFWGRNLGDERYYAGSFDGPVQDGRMNSYPAAPLTWGATFRMDF